MYKQNLDKAFEMYLDTEFRDKNYQNIKFLDTAHF